MGTPLHSVTESVALKHKDEFLDAVNVPMANGKLADTVLLPTAWDE